MKIHYRNNKLQKILENKKKLVQVYGSENALKIAVRVTDLEAADCLEDMPPAGRPHPHKGGRKGLFSLDLKHPFRLIIRPVGEFEIEDYSTIIEVEIYQIMDPHS